MLIKSRRRPKERVPGCARRQKVPILPILAFLAFLDPRPAPQRHYSNGGHDWRRMEVFFCGFWQFLEGIEALAKGKLTILPNPGKSWRIWSIPVNPDKEPYPNREGPGGDDDWWWFLGQKVTKLAKPDKTAPTLPLILAPLRGFAKRAPLVVFFGGDS